MPSPLASAWGSCGAPSTATVPRAELPGATIPTSPFCAARPRSPFDSVAISWVASASPRKYGETSTVARLKFTRYSAVCRMWALMTNDACSGMLFFWRLVNL